jgi:hypothetical protein
MVEVQMCGNRYSILTEIVCLNPQDHRLTKSEQGELGHVIELHTKESFSSKGNNCMFQTAQCSTIGVSRSILLKGF